MSGLRKMVWIDTATIAAAVAPLPFVNFWLFSILLVLVGLPVGARAAVANEPSTKKCVLIISGTLVLLLCCIYLIMFYSLNKYGS
jgi:hypothetical protein